MVLLEESGRISSRMAAYSMNFDRIIITVKRQIKGLLLLLSVAMVSVMLTKLKTTDYKRVAMIEKICPKGFFHCLVIKDTTFDAEKDMVLRTLVPEKFPDFALAQVILKAASGWEWMLPLFGRAQCQASSLLPAYYQQMMLSAPFLTGSLHSNNGTAENGRVLFTGLGARTLANHIYYHLYRVDVDELVSEEEDRYLSSIWYQNPMWNRVTVPKIREEDYNAIFVDACLNHICPPSRIVEITAQLNRTLKEIGVVVVNVNAPTKNLLHRALKRINSTLSKAYGCSVILNPNGTNTLNRVLVYRRADTTSGCREMSKLSKKKLKIIQFD